MKKRISVLMPENMVAEMRSTMLSAGYNMREKSLWVAEAIEDLLRLNDYQSLVEIAETIDNLSKTESFYIEGELEEKLNQSIVDVRKQYPALEGVKSLIVRASITRRLLKN